MTTFYYSFPSTYNSVNLDPNPVPYNNSIGQSIPSENTVSQYALNFGLSQAFSMWGNVANLSYLQGTTTPNHLNITYWNTASHGSGSTFGEQIPPNITFNTASNFWIFLNRNNNVNDPNGPADYMITNPTITNWGVWNIAHELGHTLLGDNHTTTNSGTNDLRFSIMGYPYNHGSSGNIVSNIPTQNTINLPNIGVPIPLTPGMTDINLVQNGGATPDGANGSVNYNNDKIVTAHGQSTAQDGATTYRFTETSVQLGTTGASVAGDPEKYVMTLWDRPVAAGGIDTIDAAGMNTKNYINLNAGEFSSIGSNIDTQPPGANLGGSGSADGDARWNVGIALNAQIENANGGSKEDLIIGNALANVLLGNGGADTILGGAGNDRLDGGAGIDILHGGTGSNFLIGGTDRDHFYLDVHRSVNTGSTWSTITDFDYNKVTGETATLWGWAGAPNPVLTQANAGAAGATGATYHYDLDSNGSIDTSITFANRTLAQIGSGSPGTVNGIGYIYFGPAATLAAATVSPDLFLS